MNDSLAIYIHWPFCVSKCPYCDFCSIPLGTIVKNCDALSKNNSDRNSSTSKNFTQRLLACRNFSSNSFDKFCNESKINCDSSGSADQVYEAFEKLLLIDLENAMENLKVTSIGSIFFGGGTPSLMSAESVENIIGFLQKKYRFDNDIEITLEANPGTFDQAKMRSFCAAGINRLSLGIQSFSGENLRFLGRNYDAKKAHLSAEIAGKTFDNFSVDIMYGYERHSIDSLRKDLDSAINFGCKHMSCYQLTYEKNTVFYEKLLNNEVNRIDEKTEVKHYNFINDFLEENNIFRYEVSNYARTGYESRHNLSYWKYDDYLGVGPGAHSRITINSGKNEIVRTDNIFAWAMAVRNKNTDEAYFSHQLKDIEKLQEMVIVGLRISDGINMNDFSKKIPNFDVNSIISEKKLQFLLNQKLIEKFDEKIKLTNLGFLKLNSVVEYLLS
jgi:oxygen-independent coproporphyrinogen-3 oxidase